MQRQQCLTGMVHTSMLYVLSSCCFHWEICTCWSVDVLEGAANSPFLIFNRNLSNTSFPNHVAAKTFYVISSPYTVGAKLLSSPLVLNKESMKHFSSSLFRSSWVQKHFSSPLCINNMAAEISLIINFIIHMVAPYWIAPCSSILSNHGFISDSPPTAKPRQELLKLLKVPEDGNWNICRNTAEPLTFQSAFSLNKSCTSYNGIRWAQA